MEAEINRGMLNPVLIVSQIAGKTTVPELQQTMLWTWRSHLAVIAGTTWNQNENGSGLIWCSNPFIKTTLINWTNTWWTCHIWLVFNTGSTIQFDLYWWLPIRMKWWAEHPHQKYVRVFPQNSNLVNFWSMWPFCTKAHWSIWLLHWKVSCIAWSLGVLG